MKLVSLLDARLVAVCALLFSLDSVAGEEPSNTTTSTTSTCAPTPPPCPSPQPPRRVLTLGLLSVQWGPGCTGSLVLTVPGNSSRPVCYSSRRRVEALLSGVCAARRGCRGGEELRSQGLDEGLMIYESDLDLQNCSTLIVQCQAEEERPPEEPQEPVGYRVATALLSVALILLLLLCFSKPTVRALQKRLSNKRKNRWIGPTQSHSVSYQRGQTVNKPTDGHKNASYPALDRLVVGNREPSSNRNSYNF